MSRSGLVLSLTLKDYRNTTRRWQLSSLNQSWTHSYRRIKMTYQRIGSHPLQAASKLPLSRPIWGSTGNSWARIHQPQVRQWNSSLKTKKLKRLPWLVRPNTICNNQEATRVPSLVASSLPQISPLKSPLTKNCKAQWHSKSNKTWWSCQSKKGQAAQACHDYQ